MTTAELLDLYEFNQWAHERILEAAAELGNEEYGRPVGGAFASVRATVEHLLAAEVVWLSRWEGHSLGDRPDYSGCSDAVALWSIWTSFWKRQFAFLNGLSDENLSMPVAIRTRSGIETVQTLRDTMVHVVNHSTYHRGQAASQIRIVGGRPPSTDYFIYCLSRDSGEPDSEVAT